MFETPLTADDVRVLGCLIEKQITTPEYYPLTLHALVAACNQKNNRFPVVTMDEETAVRALDRLRDRRLAATVAEAGARVPKYKHNVWDTLGLDPGQLAVLCELLLRGPQTVGELKNRAARMHAFADGAAVQAALDALAARPGEPLVAKLPRQPGTKESRHTHLLAGVPEAGAIEAASAPDEPARLAVKAEDARIERLEAECGALRTELAALRAEFDAFRRGFE